MSGIGESITASFADNRMLKPLEFVGEGFDLIIGWGLRDRDCLSKANNISVEVAFWPLMIQAFQSSKRPNESGRGPGKAQ